MKPLQRNTGHTCTGRDTRKQNNGICRESPINGRVKIHKEIENIIILLSLFVEPKSVFQCFRQTVLLIAGHHSMGFIKYIFDHATFRYWLLLRKFDRVKTIKASSHQLKLIHADNSSNNVFTCFP